MKKSMLILIALCNIAIIYAQAPGAFKYQTVVRNNNGDLVVDQPINVRISILQANESGTVVYSETHAPTTNSYGLINLNVGQGTLVSGTTLKDIAWGSDEYFLQVEVDITGGVDFTLVGVSQLLSVPYALRAGKAGSSDSTQWQINNNDIYRTEGNVGIGTSTPMGRLEIVGQEYALPEDPLFEVKNKDDQIVFGVYNEGVRVYVDDTDVKGTRGGFAVGGFSTGKAPTNEYLRVTPDSVRIYVEDAAKGTRGGFAVGGFSTGKGLTNEYLSVTPDSVRVYINEETGKSARGGFAVGGFSTGKASNSEYFSISTAASVDTINPSEAMLLWYPSKEAFLTGRVLIEDPDSVGTNSMASGFESKAVGNYSQAFGYKSHTSGKNSTALGHKAFALGDNSFALGDSAYATGDYSYSFGRHSLASGRGAIAFGSYDPGRGPLLWTSQATGDQSFAIGYKAFASGFASVAIGEADANADNSVAIGIGSSTNGNNSVALAGGSTSVDGFMAIGLGGHANAIWSLASLGAETYAYNSVAIGWLCDTHEQYSRALGYNAKAYGRYSTAMGYYVETWASKCFVTGRNCKIDYDVDSVGDTEPDDPIFIVGNGYAATQAGRENAIEILKGGAVYFPQVVDSTVTGGFPLYMQASTGQIGRNASSAKYKENIVNMEDIKWLYDLRPVNFQYINDKFKIKQYGLIAEEVVEVNPLFVSYNKKGELNSVAYHNLVTPLLKAVQEQNQEIMDLIERNKSLENKNIELENRIEILEGILLENSK